MTLLLSSTKAVMMEIEPVVSVVTIEDSIVGTFVEGGLKGG